MSTASKPIESIVDPGNVVTFPDAMPSKPLAGPKTLPDSSSRSVHVRTTPWRMVGTLVLGDVLAITAALALSVGLRGLWGDGQDGYRVSFYLSYWPVGFLFAAIFALGGLYPGAPYSAPRELRRVAQATTAGFLCLGTATFLSKNADAYSRSVLLIALPVAVLSTVFIRALIRGVCCRKAWWGYQAVIIGVGASAAKVIQNLHKHPELGIKPAVVIGEKKYNLNEIDGVPVVGNIASIRRLASTYRVPYAIVPTEDLKPCQTQAVIKRFSRLFQHVLLVPKTFGMASLWVQPVDLGGMLGLESRYRLLDTKLQSLKRMIDVLIVCAAIPVWVPLMAMVSLLVKLDSSGPVFYRQSRPGFRGRPFEILKFRTMRVGTDTTLSTCLSQDVDMCQEWETTGKIQNDPRITRVGKWLRRTSLDELPQLINVLKGQMSLVGPRPILDEQVHQYRQGWGLYVRVRPGITGCWQVGGRNRLTTQERIDLDAYYVQNWSIWLDLYLLIVTFKAVAFGKGAY